MINRRIAMSGMSILAALALAGGAAFAVFTDQASSVGNTFSTGNADLSISNDNESFADTIPGVDLDGIFPGFEQQFAF